MSSDAGAFSEAQIEQYRRDGYFLVDDLYSMTEIQGLLQRITISMMPASARYTRVAAGHDFGPEPEFLTIS